LPSCRGLMLLWTWVRLSPHMLRLRVRYCYYAAASAGLVCWCGWPVDEVFLHCCSTSFVSRGSYWLEVLPVLPLCWVGRNYASCLQADVSLWCYFEGACSRWLGYSRESIPFIFCFASLSCFGLFKGACSLCMDLYVLFVLLVSNLYCKLVLLFLIYTILTFDQKRLRSGPGKPKQV